MTELVGKGTYTPAEASRLLGVSAPKIRRWLRGHRNGSRYHPPLWTPEIRFDDRVFLGFRDLMEVRVANAFIGYGISPIRIRSAIHRAREIIGDHPLSTNRFRTDGREIFLNVPETDDEGREHERFLNLLENQYEFRSIIEPILKSVDFDADGDPILWWPAGKQARIVVDPARAFGQPIDGDSSVPTAVLASAAKVHGIDGTARVYDVARAAVQRAVTFENKLAA